MKKLPQEEHKKRVLMFISPNIIDDLTKETCQEIGKKAIQKEHRKYLKSKSK